MASGGTASKTVRFNVGGQLFEALVGTVQREPSSRLALLSRGVLPAATDAQGAIFIDR